MKKLLLWLSFVLAIGLTAQTAKAAETPSQLWVSYDAGDGNGWQWSKAMTKSGDAFVYTLPDVDNDIYLTITREYVNGFSSAGGFSTPKVQYTIGGANETSAQSVADRTTLYVYGTCKHSLKIAKGSPRTIYMKPVSGDSEGYTNMQFGFVRFKLGFDTGSSWKHDAFSTTDSSWSYDLGQVTADNAYVYVTAEQLTAFSEKWPLMHYTNNANANMALATTGTKVTLQSRNNNVLEIQGVKNKKVTVHFDINNKGEYYIWYSAVDVQAPVEVSSVNMPLKPADFANGKKHYFLVGSRMADWRLQPEWEFSVDNGNNSLKIDGARVMYTGRVEIGVVDNYDDYINQRYTRWGAPNNETIINLSTRNIDNLVNRQRFEYYSADGWRPKDVADRFIVAENDDFSDKSILGSKGAVATSIVLQLKANGDPDRWYFTIPGDNAQQAYSAVPEYLTFSLVGDAIGNEQLVKGNSFKTALGMTGWQDSWVQYDAQGQPYRDAKGNLMYQTVFQPEWLSAHPSYFNKNITVASSAEHLFEYSSRNIVMQNVKSMDLTDDPYAALYSRFDNDNNKNIGGGRNVNAGDFSYTEDILTWDANDDQTSRWDNRDARNCSNWQCFVVKDMWVNGEFKVWTGWGGGKKENEGVTLDDPQNPRWYYVNGGHGQGKFGETLPVVHSIQGYDVTQPGVSATVYGTRRDKDGANFKVDNLTYFKRVIVWYNPDEDFEKSVIQLIVEKFGPNIKAMRNPDSGSTIDLDWNVPDVTVEEKTIKVKSYEIERYTIDENGDRHPAGTRGQKPLDGKTVGDLTDPQLESDTDLTPRTYQYKIILTFKDGTVREAWSNEVTLYDASAPVQAVSYQRVVEAGAEDLDGTVAAEKLYSFDAMLDLNISSTALSQSYDGIPTRDLVSGYLIKIGETEMTDLNVTDLYVNGKKYDKKFYTDNAKTVYVGGHTQQISGYWMEVPFADFGGEVKLNLRWENCAKQEPGPAYNYEVFLIPVETTVSQFAAAQFGSSKTRFEMHIPGLDIRWTESGIAQKDYEGEHGDNCNAAMPMGTHLDATNLHAPVHYTKVNYLYARGKMSDVPVTESVRRGFNVITMAGTAGDKLAVVNVDDDFVVENIAIDQCAEVDETFPCERKLMRLQGAPPVLVEAWSAVDYERKTLVADETAKRHMGTAAPALGGIATIVLDPLAAPDFSADRPAVNGTFMNDANKNRWSVHNLYMTLALNNVSTYAASDELFRTVGFYVAPKEQTVPAAFIPANDKSARGGIVAHDNNKGDFEIDGLTEYIPFEATAGFNQSNNWSEKAYSQAHLPVIVNYYAAKQGDKEMNGTELPAAVTTLTYHYPFMSGDHVLTLTEGTTKEISLADATIATGIEGVSADADGEVIYYNMQGIRVDNPAEGQVYLMVSPAGVRKVMK